MRNLALRCGLSLVAAIALGAASLHRAPSARACQASYGAPSALPGGAVPIQPSVRVTTLRSFPRLRTGLRDCRPFGAPERSSSGGPRYAGLESGVGAAAVHRYSGVGVTALHSASRRTAVLGRAVFKPQTSRLQLKSSVVVTVAQIMARARHYPNPTRDVETDKDLLKTDFSHMRPNPNSRPGLRYPLRGAHSNLGGLTDPAINFGSNFLGADLNLELGRGPGSTPPDTMAAVGPDQVIVHLNGAIRVFDKSGNLGPLDTSTDNFWSATGALGQTGTYTTDPRVVFDPFSGRWILVMITAGGSPNDILIGYSGGPHITASSSFTLAKFQQDFGQTNLDTGYFADTPTLGVDANAVYIGCNISSAGVFQNSTVFVIPKTSLFSGSASITAFRGLIDPNTFTGPYAPQGIANFSSTAQGTGYFIGVDDGLLGTLDVLPILNPGTSPALGTLAQITVPFYNSNTFDPTPLGTTSGSISSDDFRLLGANICRNVQTGKNYILCAHHEQTDNTGTPSGWGTQDSIQWFQIDLSDLSVAQSGTLYDPNGNSLLYPSIYMSETGQLVMGFTEMGTNLRPECEVVRQVPGDSSGSFPVVATAADSGTNNYNLESGSQHWGDYSFATLDPVDGISVWTVQEYADADTFSVGGSWACQVSQVMAPPPPPVSGVTPSMVAHGYAGALDVLATPTGLGQAFSEPGSELSAYRRDIQVRFNGVDLLGGAVPTVASPTDLHMTTSGAATVVGTYAVSVTNPDGQTAGGSATLQIVPALTGFTTDASSYISGQTVTATLTLETQPAVSEPIVLTASAGGSAINLPAGETLTGASLQFDIPTNAVSSATNVQISASDPGSVHTLTASFTVNPVAVASFSLTKSAVLGGQADSGTVTLNSNAIGSGAVVTLSSNSAAATVAGSITIPAGQSSGGVSISTAAVSADTSVTITASLNGSSKTATLSVTEAAVSNLVISPTAVIGMTPVQATIVLNGLAGPSGDVVSLQSNSPALVAPPTTSIPAGHSYEYLALKTAGVVSSTLVTLTASTPDGGKSTTVTVNPAGLASVSMSRTSILGGQAVAGGVTLNGYAGPGGTTVSLSSSNMAALIPPWTVTIPQNKSSVSFTANTSTVSADAPVTVTATLGSTTKTCSITVTEAVVSALTISPTSIVGGGTILGTVVLNGLAGPSGDVISLASNPALVNLPATTTIPSGHSYVYLYWTTQGVSASTPVSVTASTATSSKTASVTLQPAALLSLTPVLSSVVGGNNDSIVATLNGLAGSGGVSVSLSSSNPAALSVPVSAAVAQGARSGSALATTYGVDTNASVTVTGVFNGVTRTCSVVVKPAGLSSILLAKTTIKGGLNTFGEIYLNGQAGASGIQVSLSSSDPSTVIVPATANVAAGKVGVYFSVVTKTVTANEQATITATYNGGSASASLTVTP